MPWLWLHVPKRWYCCEPCSTSSMKVRHEKGCHRGKGMIYTADNAYGATVYDVNRKEKLLHVMSVNDSAGWVLVAEQPVCATAHRHIASRRIRFDAIHAIKGSEPRPVLFHCYGRQA